MMFYGLGNGTLFVQLLSDTALKRETWLLLLAFLPAAAASAGLCTLGTDSLRVSSQIRVCSFLQQGLTGRLSGHMDSSGSIC